MKKLLALVLALVMTLSLATVSTNAAFDDADNIDYTEAVEVMNAIGVLEGDGTGNFNPKGILNREQAAKIISALLLTKDVANKLNVSEVKFADVNATDWAAPYIAYCAANGIVVGDGTNFYPKAELTGHAFAKMLLVAIGADGNYTGADWAINVAVDVQAYGLDENLDIVLSDKLTREEAAQMALNAALYTKTGKTYVVDGKYSFDNMTDALLYGALLEKDVEIVSGKDTLLNTVFGVTQVDGSDSFGRPAVNYKNAKNKVIVQVVDEPDYTYAGASYKANLYTKGKALYDYADYTKTVVYNGGVDTKVSANPYQKNGATVELYVDDTNETVKVIVSEGYYTEVSGKTTSLSTGITTMTLKVYEAGYVLDNSAAKVISITSEDDEYDIVADFSRNDKFIGFYNPGWDESGAIIAADANLEAVEATVKVKKADTNYNGYVTTTDGDKITFANEYSQAEISNTSAGTFYLYNGYAVHFKGVSTSVTLDQVFAIAKAWSIDVAAGKNEYDETIDAATYYYVQVIYLDGTVAVIETDKLETADANLYRVSKTTDGVSTLAKWSGNSTYKIDTVTGKDFKSSVVKSDNGNNIRLNSETLNIVANGETGSKLEVTTSNGILNSKVAGTAIVVGKKSGSNITAAYVIVPGAESLEVGGNVVYVLTEKLYADTEIDDETFYIVNVYDVNGEADVIYVKDTSKLEAGWNTYTTKDGVVETITPYTTDLVKVDGTGVAFGAIDEDSFYNDLLTVGSIVDLDVADAVVVDNCYSGAETIDALRELTDAGWTLDITLFADEGDVVIVINDVYEA